MPGRTWSGKPGSLLAARAAQQTPQRRGGPKRTSRRGGSGLCPGKADPQRARPNSEPQRGRHTEGLPVHADVDRPTRIHLKRRGLPGDGAWNLSGYPRTADTWRRASGGSSGSLTAITPRCPPSSRGRLSRVAGVLPYGWFETQTTCALVYRSPAGPVRRRSKGLLPAGAARFCPGSRIRTSMPRARHSVTRPRRSAVPAGVGCGLRIHPAKPVDSVTHFQS